MHVIPTFRSVKGAPARPGSRAQRLPLAAVLASGATLLAVLAMSACSSSTSPGVTCTANRVPGISLTVQNAVDGSPVTDSASIRISDGTYVETYNSLGSTGVITAAVERPGIYAISIRKTNFAPYTTAGVTVTSDACHVQTVQVIAALQPVAIN